MADATTTDTTDQIGVQRLLDIVRAINGIVTEIASLVIQTEEEVIPSGSTDGMPIKVVATATAGTLFHSASATALDNVWLYATNTDTSARVLTIEFGDATSPDHHILMTILPGDNLCVLPGIPLTNSKTVKCYASAANVINVYGFINRVTSL